MKRYTRYLLLLALLAAGCGRGAEPVTIHRFEQLLFDTPADQLPTVLAQQRDTYNSPLLNVAPDNPVYMEMLGYYLNDRTVRHIYRVTDSLFHDLSWLEKELGKAMKRAREVCPEVDYQRFYTLVTADMENYAERVFCHERDMAISIDCYAMGEAGELQMFGIPAYIERLCTREHIASDCMSAAARNHIELPEGDLTFLDYAVDEGKTLYFLDQVLPDVHDSIKLRYSDEQLHWMEANVENVWGWLIQNQMLYSTDLSQLRNILNDAPKTNAFGEGSAPRTGDYIGWQIVKRYMKKSGATVSQLFAETDSRKILEQSGWRP